MLENWALVPTLPVGINLGKLLTPEHQFSYQGQEWLENESETSYRKRQKQRRFGGGGEAAFLPSYRTEDLKSLLPFPFIGFPDSSVDKESASNAGDPGSVPGSGRSPAEGIRYPLQYCWASLVAQLVKNLSALWETWMQSLGWEGKCYPLQYSGLENSMDYIVHGVPKSQT